MHQSSCIETFFFAEIYLTNVDLKKKDGQNISVHSGCLEIRLGYLSLVYMRLQREINTF